MNQDTPLDGMQPNCYTEVSILANNSQNIERSKDSRWSALYDYKIFDKICVVGND
jgi:hypothetical protein